MTSLNAARKLQIPIDIIKSSLQNAAKEKFSVDSSEKDILEAVEENMKHFMRPNGDEPSTYELGGMMKTFELLVEKSENNDCVKLVRAEEKHVKVPLVHWMSRNQEYRDFLLKICCQIIRSCFIHVTPLCRKDS